MTVSVTSGVGVPRRITTAESDGRRKTLHTGSVNIGPGCFGSAEAWRKSLWVAVCALIDLKKDTDVADTDADSPLALCIPFKIYLNSCET